MATAPDSDAVLERALDSALTVVRGAAHASATMFRHGAYTTPNSSDDLAREADAYQYRAGAGPCMHAASSPGAVAHVTDAMRERRWPGVASAAEDLGFGAVMSVSLYLDQKPFGALNLYGAAPDAFDNRSQQLGQALAGHVSVALAAALERANLREALETRDLIGQAKGMLVERLGATGDEAFHLLTAASQRTHRKLRDVAGELVQTGTLPT